MLVYFSKEGCLQDVGSHIIYSPLQCRIPLPGFEGLRFCVSQYEEKERLLLKNLCFTLGAKFTEKLTKKVTHLLCKFMSGPKYEASCKWGIPSVTAEWITECVSQVISPKSLMIQTSYGNLMCGLELMKKQISDCFFSGYDCWS